MVPTIAWSDFAKGRNRPRTGYSYFVGSDEELVELVRKHWASRKPGVGRSDLDKVVIVPMPCPERFVCTSVKLEEGMEVEAQVIKRQTQEDPFVQLFARGEPEETKFASVVLYSKDALVENDGTRSSDADWEIVTLIASPVEDEPMAPLTMARNMLEKPGGTKVEYTADQLAESIYHWSLRARRLPD